MEYPPFFLLLLLTITTFTAAAAQIHGNITLNSLLTTATAGSRNLSWHSPSGDFAFGFLPLPTNSSLFLLAIWFSNLPNSTTVIWTPNRDNPLPPDSSVILTSAGQLSLRDPAGTEVWNPRPSTASHAAMLDSGDFVLAASDGSVLWDSFSDPTDTIVPTQTLTHNTNLVAKLADDDFSDGRFKLAMQTDDNLVFYQIAVPTGFQYNDYWSSGTDGSNTSARLVFNINGSIDLVSSTGALLTNLTSATTKSTSDYYHRGTLDPDGVFRHYVHPKPSATVGAAAEWTIMDFKPTDICAGMFSKVGSGVCGYNSYCSYDANKKVVCQCAVGHSWVDPNRAYMGCKLNFTMPSCVSGIKSEGFHMVRVDNINFWGTDYEHLNPMNEADCEQQCLDDCFCATAIFDGASSCWKKKLPLSNGVTGSNVQGTAFMKLGNDDNLPVINIINKRTWILPGLLALGGSVLLNGVILSLTYAFLRASKRKQRRKIKDSTLGPNLKAFTYKELEEATNGFGEELGSGASGTVYRGYLGPEPAGTPDIAVKKLRDFHLPEIDKEFASEVKSIGQTHHKNLVRLLGYCNEDTKRLLVYEYMSNGSLASYLFGGIPPPWEQRVGVTLGIARGLRYLHEECDSQIIHCDIKPQNVLLDENLNPRISDFGLAKLLRTDQTRTNTGIRGTKGYVAPEWFRNTGITAKVDVYSFGVMVLEILCCRRNVEKEMEEEKALLTFWVSDCYSDGRIEALVEGDEEAMADMGRVERFAMAALWCVQEEPALRPTMGQVIQMLEGTVGINPVPPYT